MMPPIPSKQTVVEAEDTYTVQGLPGHWHRTLELPNGYQHFNFYKDGYNDNDVVLNRPEGLKAALEASPKTDLLLYTHHEVFHHEGIIKHTRSSPNFEGGVVTYGTCKHLMRSTNRQWEGVWLVGLCPKGCAANTLLFAGRVKHSFPSNHHLKSTMLNLYPKAHDVKLALTNPRGDLYTGIRPIYPANTYDHTSFQEPPGHTRSVEFYKKSPGSISDRSDGKIPKWWRDLEYVSNGRRPPSFILSPCFLFSTPTLWTSYKPRRATLKLTPSLLAASLRDHQ